MTDRPIIFSVPMIRALLDGRKTQTRRVLCQYEPERDPPHAGPFFSGHKVAVWTDREGTPWRYPGAKGSATGDRLWVREAWAPLDALTHNDPGTQALADRGFYRADGGTVAGEIARWRSPIHMPRWASRLTLTVTDVRVQRLQDITEADAKAEGIECTKGYWTRQMAHIGLDEGDMIPNAPPVPSFASLWNSIHGPEAWAENPWVAAISFTVRQGNIDT